MGSRLTNLHAVMTWEHGKCLAWYSPQSHFWGCNITLNLPGVRSWSKEKEDCKGSSHFNSHSYWDERTKKKMNTKVKKMWNLSILLLILIVVNIRLNTYRVLKSWLHVNLSILIPWTMCRCYSLYNLLCTSTRTPLVYCHTNQCDKNMNKISGVLIQGERGLQRVVLFQLAFLLRWTKKKMNERVEKMWNLPTTWS